MTAEVPLGPKAIKESWGAPDWAHVRRFYVTFRCLCKCRQSCAKFTQLIQPLFRLADLTEWATNGAQSSANANSSIVYSAGAAAALGAMGLWWMWSSRPEGKIQPLVDPDSQTRVLSVRLREERPESSLESIAALRSRRRRVVDAAPLAACSVLQGLFISVLLSRLPSSLPPS